MQITKIITDDNQMELTEHGNQEFPVQFYFDEIDKYDLGYVKWHWHPHIELSIVKSGQAEVMINQECVRLQPGEGIFINTARMHMIKTAARQRQADMLCIVMDPSFIAPLGSRIYKQYVKPVLVNPMFDFMVFKPCELWQKDLLNQVEQVFQIEQQRQIGFEMKIHNYLNHIWLDIFLHQETGQLDEKAKKAWNGQDRIKQMLQFIHHHYPEEITLAMIADSANVSKSEAIRTFKNYVGMTPISYLIDYRLERTVHNLLTTDLPVCQIAMDCGFDSVSYFNKLFKRKLNITPLQFRLANRKIFLF